MDNTHEKKLFIFDLDGTLTAPKVQMTESMALALSELIKKMSVAVISGGGYARFQSQFLRSLPADTTGLGNLYLLPTSGTRLYIWQSDWVEKYREELTDPEKKTITGALQSAIKASGLDKLDKVFGVTIEDRGSQVTFSALGQEAPLELKLKWDPDHAKRTKLVEMLQPQIPKFDVRIGGTTSIDVTRRGINKAYGIHKLEQYMNIPISQMVFVGDALFYGGNDYPVKATGVDCISVKGPEETEALIRNWLQ